MMVVFYVTLFILFNEGIKELAVLATIFASIPVFLFLWQQYYKSFLYIIKIFNNLIKLTKIFNIFDQDINYLLILKTK